VESFLTAPVALLVTVTVAFVITSLFGSVTVPVIDPVAFCASAAAAQTSGNKNPERNCDWLKRILTSLADVKNHW
jgi:hypothetical protein